MILFTSSRPLGRCENITALWDACEGDKEFAQLGYGDSSGHPAEVVITDEFLQRKGAHQTLVMVGHGLTGAKKYGLDQPHGVYRRECCELVDWYVTSSEQTRPFAASAAGIPLERCVPLGMPRTDAYVGKRKGDGGTFMAEFERAYLFAPTFRASWEPPAPVIDWQEVDDALGDGELMVVKRHMITREPLLDGDYAHIVEVSPDEPTTPYLVDCDALVTDYSSIALDALALGKPCVGFVPDLEGYGEARGFYREWPRDYMSNTADTPSGMAKLARIAAGLGFDAKGRELRDFYAGACDGASVERVLGFIGSLP